MRFFSLFTACAFASYSLSLAANITVYNSSAAFAPNPLPPPNAASKGEEIVKLFNNLGRTTVWKLVQKTHFQGDLGEPEGMVRIGDNRIFVSAGTYSSP